MTSTYDPHNIFARLLREELPCQKVYEDEFALAFHDRFPKAPVHVLLIPKGPYTCASDFYGRAEEKLIIGLSRAIATVVRLLDLQEAGFRLISNEGLQGGQEVSHFHMHILAGRKLGPMLLASS